MKKTAMKQNLRTALGVFVRTGVAAIISVFLSLSVNIVCTAVSTEEIGNVVWEYTQDQTKLISKTIYSTANGKVTEMEVFRYKEDGEALDEWTTYKLTEDEEMVGQMSFEASLEHNLVHKTEYVSMDYGKDREYNEDTMQTTVLYSPIPPNVAMVGNIFTLIGSLIILMAVPYRYLWEQGSLDRNAINYGHQADNRWRGLQIGLLANIPAILVYLLLWVGKLGIGLVDKVTQVYVLFNSSFSSLTIWTLGENVTDATTISVGQMLILAIPALALPFICQFAYMMGRKDILISDKIMLKSNKKKRKKRKR